MANIPIKQPPVEAPKGESAPAEKKPDPNAAGSATTDGVASYAVTSEADNLRTAQIGDKKLDIMASGADAEQAETDLAQAVSVTFGRGLGSLLGGGADSTNSDPATGMDTASAEGDSDLSAQVNRGRRGGGTV